MSIEVFRPTTLLSDVPGRITAVESCGEYVYVGTMAGELLLYWATGGDEGSPVTCKLEARTMVGTKPVNKIAAIGDFAVLIVLCGGRVSVWNMYSLKPKGDGAINVGKRVMNFCVQHPRNFFRLCLQVQGAILLYEILGASEQLDLYREIPIRREAAQVVAWTTRKLFLGHTIDYEMHDLTSPPPPAITKLFDMPHSVPQIVEIEEELLLVTGNLGLFVNLEGQIARGSIAWSASPVSVGCHGAYTVALLPGDNIEVHSIQNQKLVQQIPATNVHFQILSCGAKTLLAAGTTVYCFSSTGVMEQLRQYVKLGRMEEATSILKSTWGNTREFDQKLREFHHMTGIVLFSKLQWNEAVGFLSIAGVDPRELISFFPDLIPPSCKGTYETPNTQNVVSIIRRVYPSPPDAPLNEQQLVKLGEAKAALLAVLQNLRNRTLAYTRSQNQWLDMCLVKLLVDQRPELLEDMIESKKVDMVLEDVEWLGLREAGLHHCLAEIFRAMKLPEKALDEWRAVGTGRVRCRKEGFDGVQESVALLKHMRDRRSSDCGNKAVALRRSSTTVDSTQVDVDALYAEYSPWLLQANPSVAVAIYTCDDGRGPCAEQNVDEVVAHLERLCGRCTEAEDFIEHMIFQHSLESEQYHTRLAKSYLQRVQNVMGGAGGGGGSAEGTRSRRGGTTLDADLPNLLEAQERLIKLLRFSNSYNVSTLLALARGSDLHEVNVILLSKLGRHEEALDILVHKMQDYEAADQYCATNDSRDGENLFSVLLQLYMRTGEEGADSIPENAFRLLNNRGAELDAVAVLSSLPPSMSIASIEPFLRKVLQHSIHEQRMCNVERHLCKGEQLTVRVERVKALSASARVDQSVVCGVCSRPIGGTMFTAYPNGVLVHFKCMEEKHVCPVTQRNFIRDPMEFT